MSVPKACEHVWMEVERVATDGPMMMWRCARCECEARPLIEYSFPPGTGR